MRKRLFAIAICLLVTSAIGAQTKRPMNYDDIMALKTVGGTAISPDGKQALYTLSYAEMKENERRTEIWIVSTDGGKPRRFTSG